MQSLAARRHRLIRTKGAGSPAAGPGLGRGEPEEKDAIAVLASLTVTMDDIDAGIDELAERTRTLDLD